MVDIIMIVSDICIFINLIWMYKNCKPYFFSQRSQRGTYITYQTILNLSQTPIDEGAP